jgi:hypothetical protein
MRKTRLAKGLNNRPLSGGLALPMKRGKAPMKMSHGHGTGVGVKTKRYTPRSVGKHRR